VFHNKKPDIKLRLFVLKLGIDFIWIGLIFMGRPSIFSEELAETILNRLAGGESLRSICRDDSMPAMSSVLLWVVDGRHKSFSEQYAIARAAQGYYYADSILEISAELARGELDHQSAKVIIDAYKWTAERNAPKAYASKQSQTIEVSGPDGGPVQSVSMSPAEFEEIARKLHDEV
jgi:hypothetical protein